MAAPWPRPTGGRTPSGGSGRAPAFLGAGRGHGRPDTGQRGYGGASDALGPSSLSRRGADLLKPEARPHLLGSDMQGLMARTHGGNFSSPNRRPLTGTSLWSNAASEASDMQGFKAPQGASRASGSAANKGNRFYMTAPAGRIEFSAVEEATGVRLSKDQLQALRKRYQGGHGRFGEGGGFGEAPSADGLRQEVFGSMVLRPGQWPKANNDAGSECDSAPRQGTAQRMVGGSCSLPRANGARRGTPG